MPPCCSVASACSPSSAAAAGLEIFPGVNGFILEGKIKNGKSGYFTTDYTDFDGFHGEDHCFLTNYPLTQRISDSIFITL
jgi:hypothetical protein